MDKNFMDYLLPVAVTLLYLLALAKDWEGHKYTWRRGLALLLILIIGFASIFNVYLINQKRIEEQNKIISNRKEDRANIAGIASEVIAVRKDQESNKKIFSNDIASLANEVVGIQSRVGTAWPREEAAKLNASLEAARNPPKAALDFSFGITQHGIPLKEITLPVKNNIVHVEFAFLNSTGVTAMSPYLIIEICKECEFFTEPKGFTKTPGGIDTNRQIHIDKLMPAIFNELREVDIKVPPGASSVVFGMEYRCDNCSLQIPAKPGTIFLSR